MAKKRVLSAEFKRDAVKLARAREGKSMSANNAPIVRRERLGGLLSFYHRLAA